MKNQIIDYKTSKILVNIGNWLFAVCSMFLRTIDY